MYNPNESEIEVTIEFKNFPTGITYHEELSSFNQDEAKYHKNELDKFNSDRMEEKKREIERITKEKVIHYSEMERERQARNKRYQNKDTYSTLINLIFVIIFSLVLVLAMLLIIIICCRIFYSYVERSHGFMRRFTRKEFPTLNRKVLNKKIPKRKLGTDLGKYGDKM